MPENSLNLSTWEIATLIAPFAIQGLSWLVKKSPWGWDNTALEWIIKNKAGITNVAAILARRIKP